MIAARLADGTDIQAVQFDGRLLHLVCPGALAPGQPADVTLSFDAPFTLMVRTVGSRRRDDGAFDVRCRIVNLRREHREKLESELS